MPISQGRLITCLILSAFSATTWADSVLVNTTADKSIDDEFCSLREAVSYVNQKNITKAANEADINVINHAVALIRNDLTAKTFALAQEKNKEVSSQNKTLIASLTTEIDDPTTGLKKQITDKESAITAKEKELEAFRAKGIAGCKSDDNSATESIKLQKSDVPYEVNNSAIIINLTVTISPAVLSTNGEDPLSNLENSNTNTDTRMVIKAIGNHALFMIDDGQKAPIRYISATFNDLDFQGCNTNFCDTHGGIFSNREELVINNSVISGGIASILGGAIYNDKNSIFAVNQVSFENNQAPDGAAIYSEQTSLFLGASLFTKNTASNGHGIVTVADKAAKLRGTLLPSIVNSTFSGNVGTALSTRETLALKNLTIVLNSDGINFNGEPPLLYSSIIAANSKDCINMGKIPDDKGTYVANNIYQTGCELVLSSPDIAKYNPNQTQLPSGEKIIADTDINGKNCAAPPADGLLCPLSYNGGVTKTHKPRILVKYTKLSDSWIVSKGASSTSIGDLVCPPLDQRAQPRVNCDIGAFELQTLISTKQGQDITFGQKATLSLFEKIGDAELLPADQCESVYGFVAGGYKDGCVRIIDLPTKGVVSFDNANHNVLYATTVSDFHGFDAFSYGLTTTLSRFSDARNDQEVKVNVRVVSEPAGSLSSKSLDTGATSIFSLLMLGLLMVWRRTR